MVSDNSFHWIFPFLTCLARLTEPKQQFSHGPKNCSPPKIFLWSPRGSDYRTFSITRESPRLVSHGARLAPASALLPLCAGPALSGSKSIRGDFPASVATRGRMDCLRVGGFNLVQMRHRVGPIGGIQEKHARLTILVSMFCNLIKQLSSLDCLIDYTVKL